MRISSGPHERRGLLPVCVRAAGSDFERAIPVAMGVFLSSSGAALLREGWALTTSNSQKEGAP